ncbi:hypothetical protein DV736_g3356, partial [Chaetothyriales sp. CBS 134916]
MRTPILFAGGIGAIGALGAWYAYSTPASSLTATPTASATGSSATTPTDLADANRATLDTGRRALVVDNDQFFTGDILGQAPLAKDTDDYGRKVLEMMTPAQATERLRKTEQSFLVSRGSGVVRYDVVQLPSNDPIEDDHAEKIVQVPNTVAATDADSASSSSDWMFWAVFDGHSGWTTSAKLREALISRCARELNTTYRAALANKTSPFPAAAAVDAALKTAFVKLDKEICIDSVARLTKSPSKRLAAEILAPALSGSCALLSFWDSRSKTLRVACTGDSRAVLGRFNPATGKWYATPLSEDQTGSNPNEEARMRAEHPGEPHVIRAGRVLGNLEPTRAFGDAFYKWTRETQDRIKKHFFGRSPHPLLQTPPYVTAEPVVTSTQIDPSRRDFVVMATDGLWEMLTNEEAVGLVGQWIEKEQGDFKKAAVSGSSSPPPPSSSSSSNGWLSSWFGALHQDALPVEKGGNMDKTGRIQPPPPPGQKAAPQPSDEKPIRQQQWNLPIEAQSRFVVQDRNVATHLVRNALGGKDSDMVCALLTLPSPYSRRYRDDLTVEVIFFGDGPDTGLVSVNADATARASHPEGGVKAKL